MVEVKGMSENGLIYLLRCPISNGIRYIGQTVCSLKVRLGKHISDSKRNQRHISCWIMSLIDKGVKPIIELVGEYPISELDDKEIYYIDFYKNQGFDLTNADLGGQGRRVFSQQTKDKIAKSLTGHRQSDETKEKRRVSVNKAWECPKLREAQRARTSNLNKLGITGMKGRVSKKKGKPFVGDKGKISYSLKEYFSITENRNKVAENNGQKPFNVYHAKTLLRANRYRKETAIEIGELALTHINLNEAARVLGVTSVNARKCLPGERKIVQGYHFVYSS